MQYHLYDFAKFLGKNIYIARFWGSNSSAAVFIYSELASRNTWIAIRKHVIAVILGVIWIRKIPSSKYLRSNPLCHALEASSSNLCRDICFDGCCLSSLGCLVVRKQHYYWTVNSQKCKNYWSGTQDACAIGSITNRVHEPMVEFALKAASALGHENGLLVGRLRELWFRYQYRPCGLWYLPIFLIQWRTQEFCSGGSTNSFQDRGQKERGSGGGSPVVRGSGGSCNLVQEISFHIVKL